MFPKVRIVTAVFAVFAAECGAQELTSLVQLIATPGQFDGKVVQVTGFCNLEFEGSAVYLHQDDYRFGHSRNGIWLDVGGRTASLKMDERISRAPELRSTHCLVRGVFSANNKGHGGIFSGALTKIDRYEKWPPYPPTGEK